MERLARIGCFALLLVCAATFTAYAAEDAKKPAAKDTPARRAFERFKSLAGTWEGKSSKGWTEVLRVRPIAGGSCVMEESEFAHGTDPQNAMVTMYHLDGDHLMLTHYCMAKNQPRLRATEISDDGLTLTFTYHDATGMASRDVGHMDKVVFRFDGNDPNRYRSQWTFYKDGQERWMEDITFERKDAPAPTTQPK